MGAILAYEFARLWHLDPSTNLLGLFASGDSVELRGNSIQIQEGNLFGFDWKTDAVSKVVPSHLKGFKTWVQSRVDGLSDTGQSMVELSVNVCYTYCIVGVLRII